jgi:hypothetical protein
MSMAESIIQGPLGYSRIGWSATFGGGSVFTGRSVLSGHRSSVSAARLLAAVRRMLRRRDPMPARHRRGSIPARRRR